MKKSTLFRFLAVSLLVLCAILFAGCSNDAPDINDYFSEEEIASWKKESKEDKYAMNGGYFISFQGHLYPVVFEHGKIIWKETPPDDLLFVTMYELFTDKALRNRCAYQGLYEQWILFSTDTIDYEGFLVDGKAPKYGTVLYIDENRLRRVDLEYAYTPFLYPDEELIPSTQEGRAESYFVCGDIVLSDEHGVFKQDLNTIRKLCAYAREHGIPFDAYTEYTNLPYPSSLFSVYDDRWWNHPDTYDQDVDILFKPKPVDFSDSYCVTFSYHNEQMQDIYCLVLTDKQTVNEFHQDIRVGDFTDVIYDENGVVISCYAKHFFGYEKGANVSHIFYSEDDFHKYIKSCEYTTDTITQMALSYFSATENGAAFDEQNDYLLYSNDIGYHYSSNDYSQLTLHANWAQCRVVSLRAGDRSEEIIICEGQSQELPRIDLPCYEFVGWYADQNYSGTPITTIDFDNNHSVLYAKYQEVDHYTLTFEPYGDQSFDNLVYSYGDEKALPVVRVPFHVFLGWCTDKDCTTEPIQEITSEFFGNYHLYPYVKPIELTISYVINDTASTMTVPYGEEFTLPIPSEDSQGEFIGYYDIYGTQYTDNTGKSLKPFIDGADIQLFAHFKEN